MTQITCKSGKGREVNPHDGWAKPRPDYVFDTAKINPDWEQWNKSHPTLDCLTPNGEVAEDGPYEAELVWQQNTALGWVTLTAKHDEGYRPEIHRQVYIIQPTESGKEQLIAQLHNSDDSHLPCCRDGWECSGFYNNSCPNGRTHHPELSRKQDEEQSALIKKISDISKPADAVGEKAEIIQLRKDAVRLCEILIIPVGALTEIEKEEAAQICNRIELLRNKQL